MRATLARLFEALEADRLNLLTELGALPEVTRSKAQPGQWSIHAVVAHLIAAERLSLQYMQKKSLGIATLRDSGWKEQVMTVVLIVSQRLPLKFRAPGAVVAQTSAADSLEELTTQWAEARGDLKKFIDELPDVYLRRIIYRHIIAGRLDVRQCLIFIREHMRHHRPQLRRLARQNA